MGCFTTLSVEEKKRVHMLGKHIQQMENPFFLQPTVKHSTRQYQKLWDTKDLKPINNKEIFSWELFQLGN